MMSEFIIKWSGWAVGLAFGLAIRGWIIALVDWVLAYIDEVIPGKNMDFDEEDLSEKSYTLKKETVGVAGTCVVVLGLYMVWKIFGTYIWVSIIQEVAK